MSHSGQSIEKRSRWTRFQRAKEGNVSMEERRRETTKKILGRNPKREKEEKKIREKKE